MNWRDMIATPEAHDAPELPARPSPKPGTLEGFVFRTKCPTCDGAGAIATALYPMCCPTCDHTGWLDVAVSVAELRKMLEEER